MRVVLYGIACCGLFVFRALLFTLTVDPSFHDWPVSNVAIPAAPCTDLSHAMPASLHLGRSSRMMLQNLVRRRSGGTLSGAVGSSPSNLPSSLLLHRMRATGTPPLAPLSSSGTSRKSESVFEMRNVVKVTTNSRMANREDTKAAVQTALEGREARRVDPILFKGIFPSSSWLVELSSREDAERLLQFKRIHAGGGWMKVEALKEDGAAGLELASQQGLDDRCIQLQHVPPNMGVDEVAYFFRDFQVDPKSIRQVGSIKPQASLSAWERKTGSARTGSSSFVMCFTTADEAQRAIRERQFERWGDRRIQLVPYK